MNYMVSDDLRLKDFVQVEQALYHHYLKALLRVIVGFLRFAHLSQSLLQ